MLTIPQGCRYLKSAYVDVRPESLRCPIWPYTFSLKPYKGDDLYRSSTVVKSLCESSEADRSAMASLARRALAFVKPSSAGE